MNLNPSKKKVVWIHASSGEVEYARSVIRALQNKRDHYFILLTFASPSALKLIYSFQTDVDAWGPTPWDTRKNVCEFIKTWNPSVVLFARTDVWPELSYQLRQKQIPTLLFSATLSAESSRTRGFAKPLTQWAFNHLSEINCVSEADLINFKSLKISTPLFVRGDTRYDQIFHRLENPKKVNENLKPQHDQLTFVLGSTWPEDEKVFLPLIHKFKNIKWILVPHENTKSHLNWLKEQLRLNGVDSFQFYSESNEFNSQVLIVDQVGILAEIYSWAQFAFVGGSFRKQVHSVMEPLALGLPVLLGPFYKNNREAIQFKDEVVIDGQKMIQVVNNSLDFETALRQMTLMNYKEFNKQILAKIKTQCGATNTVLQWIEKNIH